MIKELKESHKNEIAKLVKKHKRDGSENRQVNEIAKLVTKHKRDMSFNRQPSRHQYENLCVAQKMKERENSIFTSLVHIDDKLRNQLKTGTNDPDMLVKNSWLYLDKDPKNTKLKKEIDALKQNSRMVCITDMIS